MTKRRMLAPAARSRSLKVQRGVRRKAVVVDLQGRGAREDAETGDQSWWSGGSTSGESAVSVGRPLALEARRWRRGRRCHLQGDGTLNRESSLLAENAVVPRDLACRRRELQRFGRLSGMTVGTAAGGDLDEALVKYLESLFINGEDRGRAVKFAAAELRNQPKCGRVDGHGLPRSWKALRGWRRRCPARSRSPEYLKQRTAIINELAREVWLKMAARSVRRKSARAAPCQRLSLTRRSSGD